ncbi:hypothetical protein C8Q75DRAFT_745820 [Abortiporus biennis]|nr:hypothetical protein C8Q75DRAFT_745820 [Abortiporus biennis]
MTDVDVVDQPSDVFDDATKAQRHIKVGNERRRLSGIELFWRNRQPFFESKGYMLRPRYKPGWVPSWNENDIHWDRAEDAVEHDLSLYSLLDMDAVRISDGEVVVISAMLHARRGAVTFLQNPHEEFWSHPYNHLVPLLDVFDDHRVSSAFQFFVYPYLIPLDDSPRIDTAGEALDILRQVIEGTYFMHTNGLFHEKGLFLVPFIFLDPRPQYPSLFHPMKRDMKRDFSGPVQCRGSRTKYPTRYYILWTDTNSDAPEFDRQLLHHKPPAKGDPFQTDVYYLGKMINHYFVQTFVFTILPSSNRLKFLIPLVKSMLNPDPIQRPKMDAVLKEFESLCNALPWWRTRRCLPIKFARYCSYCKSLKLKDYCKQLAHTWNRRPAIPTAAPPNMLPKPTATSTASVDGVVCTR